MRAVTQDGRTLDLLASAVMVTGDSGEPVCLLRLELGRTNDVGVLALPTEMQGCIVSMARLHETLQLADNLGHVDLATYVHRLVNQIVRSMAPVSGRVALRVSLEPGAADLERAVRDPRERAGVEPPHAAPGRPRGRARTVTTYGAFELDLSTHSAALGADYAALLGHGSVPVREGLDRWFDRCHPTNLDQLRHAIEQCAYGETGSLQLLVRQRANNGAWRTIRLTAVAVETDDTGRVRRLAGDAANLPDAPPAVSADDDDARLRARLDAVHALQSSSQAILYALERRHGQIAPVTVSGNVERLLGFTEAEALVPDWWLEHVHPDDREQALTAFSTVSTQDSVVHEYRFVRKDGVTVLVQDTARVVRRDAQGPIEIVGSWTDITASHEAEHALRDRDVRLSLAMEAAHQAFWELDLRESTSPLGERTHPDDVERVTTAWADYLAGRRDTYAVEFRQRTDSGDWAWIHSSGTVVERDAFERPARVLGIHANITDRKHAELRAERLLRLTAAFARCNEAILRSRSEKELLPQLCEIVVRDGGVAMAWIGVADEDTGLVKTVASYGDGRGYLDGLVLSIHADDPLGQGPAGSAIRENRPYWVDDFSSDAATAPWHDRGTPFGWATSGCLPLVRAGRAVGVLTMYARERELFDETGRALLADLAADISVALDTFDIDRRRQQSERALQRTARELADLHELAERTRLKELAIEAAPASMALTTLEGRVTYVNRAFLRLWGFDTPAEVIGRHASEFWAEPAEVTEIAAALRERRTWTGEMLARSTSGAQLRLLVSAVLVTDEHGAVVCLLGAFEDITGDQRKAEIALRASLREKEALLLEVHHRVKNNLQVMSSLLRLKASRRDSAEVKAVLGDMQHRILSMAVLHELLYRSGNVVEVDLAAYLDALAHRIFGSLAPPGRRIELSLTLAPTRVEIDLAVPCGLLVNELISNSLKHAFPEQASGTVAVELAALEGGTLRLAVRDTGIGLPAHFELERTPSLGLQLVSDLARQLRATLGIGTTGPGASFTLTFVPQHPSAPHL